MTTVIFSHGKESGPWGSKIKTLSEVAKKRGCQVDSIDYRDLPSPEARVERLITTTHKYSGKVIYVGSSMGGYVSLVAAHKTQPCGVFLLAPALYMPTYAQHAYPYEGPVSIVHGWKDDVIPVEHAIRYGQNRHCDLLLIDGDHRLNSVLPTLAQQWDEFLVRINGAESKD